MSEETGGIEGQLYGIWGNLSDIAKTLERIATALERMAPEGSEREQIALRLFIRDPYIGAEPCFRHADKWIAERDRQRIRQAE